MTLSLFCNKLTKFLKWESIVFVSMSNIALGVYFKNQHFKNESGYITLSSISVIFNILEPSEP